MSVVSALVCQMLREMIERMVRRESIENAPSVRKLALQSMPATAESLTPRVDYSTKAKTNVENIASPGLGGAWHYCKWLGSPTHPLEEGFFAN